MNLPQHGKHSKLICLAFKNKSLTSFLTFMPYDEFYAEK